jgi:hypothetical protein
MSVLVCRLVLAPRMHLAPGPTDGACVVCVPCGVVCWVSRTMYVRGAGRAARPVPLFARYVLLCSSLLCVLGLMRTLWQTTDFSAGTYHALAGVQVTSPLAVPTVHPT